ncbi:hypothetical protein HF329_27065 [Chitinophaga oryzae]|uniref:Uncharacterized protein n=1 Tax=Chitinophaga oryzae TaxID=2725414 RepID=A0AAE6ZK81_9BACT|nr:hypothetical protein [Chitinophaga oryzae]QJB34761.1 hypothetical protein HF329_27065 [Chitinophaga oryzae]
MKKDVTHAALFDTLLSGEIGDRYYDLHNDFECIRITYSLMEKKLELRFTNDDDRIVITFLDARMAGCNLHPVQPRSIINLFHRGHFEMNNNYHEMTSKGEYYYCLSFSEDDKLEVFARQVVMEMKKLNS